MEVTIPYGSQAQPLIVPAGQVVGTYLPEKLPAAPNPEARLRQSIELGIQRCGIDDKAKPGAKACIVVTDRTRTTPNRFIVPVLLEELNARGIADEDITILIGLGMHARDNPRAIADNVGQAVAERVEVLNHEPDNAEAMIRLGETSFGTPVEVHERYAEADVRLGTGNVNPCMLAGWSGGGKIVLPGVASRRSIYENHKRFTRTLAELRCGSLMGVMPPQNIIRADLEEAATISGLDMLVNTALNAERKIVDVYSGAHVAAHRAAVERMRPYVEVRPSETVDIMVAGVGEVGFEVSLFQGGSRVCGGVDRYLKDGGTLVMVNECREGIYEGFEHREFREWMRQMPTPARLAELTEQMEIGGEKSCVLYTFSWLIHERGCRIVIVTENMTAEELEEVHLGHACTVQNAVDEALSRHGPNASIAIMPYAGLVLPVLAKRETQEQVRANDT
ncbi:MAG: Lactate racemase [Anaerolineales bacterium]|nr:Lactate racemase [Anaerolineales bacterium]